MGWNLREPGSNSLPTFYHSIDTMTNIPFAQIFKAHLIGEKDPYWRTVELRKAFEAKYSKLTINYQLTRLNIRLLRNLGKNLQFTELSAERFPK